MNKYETMFIVSLQNGEDAAKEIVEKFKNMLETQATLDSFNEWGKRRLAYPIQDLNDGFYVLAEFSAAADFPAELERNFKITEGILRYMVIRKEV
ncbi:MAG: 30S ribosomal protein S6 [Clostridiales bacterium]|jgi:small subunit ribosomal protein S6|nr:30S ribosomal protein S6 [Clostridiales bacterium]